MGDRPEIVYKDIKSIKPYERNPRKNDSAVDSVAESIKQFGFKVPVVIDKDGTIVCGHTRYKAAKKLGIDEIPCIVADDLTEEQITAYRHIA
jgi:ParB-like chromosome segregation protein Spo0J